MKHVFENIYEAENFDEKIQKRCCRGVAPFLIKCLKCKEIVCFNHVRVVKIKDNNGLVCFACVFKF